MEKPLKILVIRFSSIGDIVLTTPIVRCLHKTFPDAEIHYLTKASLKNIISDNPNIYKFHFYKNDLKKIIAELKKERFTYIIDLHHNFRTWIVKTRLGVKSYSFNKLNFEKWLMVNFKIDRLPRKHIVDRYFETVASLGVVNDNEGLDFFINDVDEVDVAKISPMLSNGYVAVVLSGTFFTKRFPNEKIISLCNKLNSPVVLLGGNSEVENGIKIIKGLESTKVYNGVNKYGIAQSASLVRQANAVVTNDTGLMHIAAAFKKKIISVWGNTIPEFGMTPYYGNKELEEKNSIIMEIKDLYCRPCTKLGYDHCPEKHFRCMRDIDEEGIIKALGMNSR